MKSGGNFVQTPWMYGEAILAGWYSDESSASHLGKIRFTYHPNRNPWNLKDVCQRAADGARAQSITVQDIFNFSSILQLRNFFNNVVTAHEDVFRGGDARQSSSMSIFEHLTDRCRGCTVRGTTYCVTAH